VLDAITSGPVGVSSRDFFHSTSREAGVIKWARLLQCLPQKNWRQKIVHNFSRFLTTFDFDREYLRKGSTYQKSEKISRSHGSVRVVRTTSKVNGKCWILTPKPPMNPLSDRHQILHAWLRHGYLPPRKKWGQSVRGLFSPHTRNIHPNVRYFATLTHV